MVFIHFWQALVSENLLPVGSFETPWFAVRERSQGSTVKQAQIGRKRAKEE